LGEIKKVFRILFYCLASKDKNIEFEVLTAVVMNVAIFWDIARLLAARWFLARLISTLKIEMIRYSETLVYILTTRRYIPEDNNIQR
jgi:hypothetical protein